LLLAPALVTACAGGRRFEGTSPTTGTHITKPPASTTSTGPTTTTTTTVVPLPVYPVGWLPCGSGLECGTVAVPLDYAHPQRRILGIALERHRAADGGHRIGSLVINPGGPGDSGIDDLPTELRILTPDLVARFDIVSFDPRGVARSAPIHCSAPNAAAAANTSAPLPDPVPQTDSARQDMLQSNRSYAQRCQQFSGDLLPFVGTVDTARDLDRIRAALGDERLTFLGHSYGTLLGASYAEAFPGRVRAMVLDGAIDPALSLQQMSLNQAVGFDASLKAFMVWCASTAACSWRPGADLGAALASLLAGVRAHPLTVGNRSLGPGELYLGVLGTLYARSFWPSLGQALADAQHGSGGQLLALADSYQHHGSTNAGDANAAITCLDHPASPDLATYPVAATAAGTQAPFFGPVFAWGGLECGTWPVAATRDPHPIRASGAPPILVVGTTADPATPYAWAVALAGELEHGVLVGRQGIDHVAYYYSSCVRSIDARYLIDGVLPARGTICTS
jgi:pimeloyl-ACP methyl ester carboxylesterase